MKKAIIKILLLSLLLTNYSFTEEIKFYNPSFNCTNVEKNSIEFKICTNKELSSLDQNLNNLYLRLIEKDELLFDKKIEVKIFINGLKKTQLNWLLKIRNQCNSIDCIAHVYQDRVNNLANFLPKLKNFYIKKSSHMFYTYTFEYDANSHNSDFQKYFQKYQSYDYFKKLIKTINLKNSKKLDILNCEFLVSTWYKINESYGALCSIKEINQVGNFFICHDTAVGHFQLERIASKINLYDLMIFVTRNCTGG